jgi:hypothetical protein
MRRGSRTGLFLAMTCAASHALAQDAQPPEKKVEAAPAEPAPAGQAQQPTAGAEPPAAGAPAPAPGTAPGTAVTTPAAPAAPGAAPAPAAQPQATTPAPAAAAAPAAAEKPKKQEGTQLTASNQNQALALGLSPGAPQVATLAGGVTPSFGQTSTRAEDWRFDFHGFLYLPLRIGINKREHAGAGQKVTTLHTPPVIPGDYTSFGYTAVNPDPWSQLNFSYGNRDVTANVIVAARSVTNGASYFNPSDQLGISDAFLTFRLPASEAVKLSLDVGAFANRYGAMGEYDLGRYGTPLIARVAGVGFTGSGNAALGGEVDLAFEAGLMGQLNKAPVGMEPAGWNDFADPNVGTSYAAHGHASLGFGGKVQVGGHLVYAFVQDDRATSALQKDGSITIGGGDFRLTLGRFGHFYAGVGHTRAKDARGVSGVVRVLNAPGGPGLMTEYFGPNSGGTGQLTLAGAQYDLSLGNLLRYPERFNGDGPDLIASLFGIFTHVGKTPSDPGYDQVDKFKYGGELTYSMLSWLALSGRYDRVIGNLGDAHQTYAVLSPRVIFRTDFNAHDQVVLQYSRYMVGSGVPVKAGYPPVYDYTIIPDKDVISLTAAMWW